MSEQFQPLALACGAATGQDATPPRTRMQEERVDWKKTTVGWRRASQPHTYSTALSCRYRTVRNAPSLEFPREVQRRLGRATPRVSAVRVLQTRLAIRGCELFLPMSKCNTDRQALGKGRGMKQQPDSPPFSVSSTARQGTARPHSATLQYLRAKERDERAVAAAQCVTVTVTSAVRVADQTRERNRP